MCFLGKKSQNEGFLCQLVKILQVISCKCNKFIGEQYY